MFSSAEYGTIAVSKDAFTEDELEEDALVTVTVTPADRCYLKSLVYNDGEDHDITEAKAFTMPKADVTVTAVFGTTLMPREQVESVAYSSKANILFSAVLTSGGVEIDEGGLQGGM